MPSAELGESKQKESPEEAAKEGACPGGGQEEKDLQQNRDAKGAGEQLTLKPKEVAGLREELSPVIPSLLPSQSFRDGSDDGSAQVGGSISSNQLWIEALFYTMTKMIYLLSNFITRA